MNYTIVVPLMIGLTMILLRALTSRRKDESDPSGENTYRYDPAAVGMLLAMLFIILSTPLWLPYVQPGKNNNIVYIGCGFISSVGFIGCFWLYIFRIKIFNEFIEYGAIFNKRIYFNEIRRVKIAKNDAKGVIVIYPIKGFRVVFSYTLRNYLGLKSDIEKKVLPENKVEYF
jgi:hypothetical protein